MDKGSFNRLTNALIFRNCEWRVAGFCSNKISIKNDNEVAGGGHRENGRRERERARDAETRNEQGKKHKDTVDQKQPKKKARSRQEKRKRHGVKKSDRGANCGGSIDQPIDRWISRSNRRQ